MVIENCVYRETIKPGMHLAFLDGEDEATSPRSRLDELQNEVTESLEKYDEDGKSALSFLEFVTMVCDSEKFARVASFVDRAHTRELAEVLQTRLEAQMSRDAEYRQTLDNDVKGFLQGFCEEFLAETEAIDKNGYIETAAQARILNAMGLPNLELAAIEDLLLSEMASIDSRIELSLLDFAELVCTSSILCPQVRSAVRQHALGIVREASAAVALLRELYESVTDTMGEDGALGVKGLTAWFKRIYKYRNLTPNFKMVEMQVKAALVRWDVDGSGLIDLGEAVVSSHALCKARPVVSF